MLLSTKIGLRNVWFQGPSNRSGGVTGQYWHPPSGSEVKTAKTNRETSLKTLNASSITCSGEGAANGRLSLHDTAARARSPRYAGVAALTIAVPLPCIACAMFLAVSIHVMGICKARRRYTASSCRLENALSSAGCTYFAHVRRSIH